MSQELTRCIKEKEDGTFQECFGLAVEFMVKARVVIELVYASGRQHIYH